MDGVRPSRLSAMRTGKWGTTRVLQVNEDGKTVEEEEEEEDDMSAMVAHAAA